MAGSAVLRFHLNNLVWMILNYNILNDKCQISAVWLIRYTVQTGYLFTLPVCEFLAAKFAKFCRKINLFHHF